MSDSVSQTTRPNAAMIGVFAKALFGDCDGWVAVREFAEKGTATRPPNTPFLAADSALAANLVAEANTAADLGLALYVVAGTVSERGKAKAADVVAMQSSWSTWTTVTSQQSASTSSII
jgi:hypothetical protein